MDIYFECVNEEKYLVFALIDKNLNILENYKKLWDKIKMDIKKLERIVGNLYFQKNIMKVKFDADDDLVFNKIINVPMCATAVKKLFMNMIINFILKYIYIVVILIVLMVRVVMYV